MPAATLLTPAGATPPRPSSPSCPSAVSGGQLHLQTATVLQSQQSLSLRPPPSSSSSFSSFLPSSSPSSSSSSTPPSPNPPPASFSNGLPVASLLASNDLLHLDSKPLFAIHSSAGGALTPSRKRCPLTLTSASAPTAATTTPQPNAALQPSQLLTPAPSPTDSHNAYTPASSPSAVPPRLAQKRKPSPGLAARLKALGFSSSAPKAPLPPSTIPTHPDHIGRLPEDQLREIDQKHQAGSSVSVIERRGRPWKGTGAVVAGFPTSVVASIVSGRPKAGVLLAPDASIAAADAESDMTAAAASHLHLQASAPSSAPVASFLPEIKPSLPLEMDTNKYRLPDHSTENGSKIQPDTRQQHLDRDPSAASSLRAPSPSTPPPPLPKDTPPLPQLEEQLPQKQLQQPQQQQPPPPPPPPGLNDFNPNASYFNPLGLQRAGSIYTLSRVSFANQLAQLTSLQLPDAESLSSKVSAIPTAQSAARALIGAADQIRNWISKASEVIDGLDSDDDVEWAAAGGREGLEEVENAIIRFEELINVYVGAIEELQGRHDIASVTPDDLQLAVFQMESIMAEWRRMRVTLQSVKAQVEIAMEWEELWGMVLGDIQNEMDDLSRLVFEMEERRHRSMTGGASTEGPTGAALGVDIGDLETIVEETQQQQQQPPSTTPTRTAAANNRFSIPIFPTSPLSPDAQAPSTPSISQDDSSLLALFARMQPLRASLDFLPMRLSVFETRASSCFPTACDELEMRRAGLDTTYKKLEQDAESLRKELGEDRWVAVFRGAARQAQKMYESVERSVSKLKESIDAGMHLTNQPLMAKKIESYETKKMHYGPAIERVLAIIDKGVKDRLTLNGEILRLYTELQEQWDNLRDRMRDLDQALEEIQANEHRNQQLRDSISSMLSNDRSTLGSAHDTPQSSPPSSVIMSSLGIDMGRGKRHATSSAHVDKTTPTSNRRRGVINTNLPQPATRRSMSSSAATSSGVQTRRTLTRFPSSTGSVSGAGSTLSSPSRESSVTPQNRRTSIPTRSSVSDGRPRWNSSTTGVDTGHNFKPLTLTTPSPYAKTPPSLRRGSTVTATPGSASSLTTKLPMRSPLSRATSSSPKPDGMASCDPPGFRDAPPYRPPRASNRTAASMAAVADARRASFQPPRQTGVRDKASDMVPRPASSMATSHRSSTLSGSRLKRESSISGRESPQAVAGARAAMRKKAEQPDNKPRWRG